MVVGGRELIDTLWNVNLPEPYRENKGGERINRYIMECKYIRDFLNPIPGSRINRYIMECK